jgi:micrococcal nuclease
VIDGDTIEIQRLGRTMDVRLIGIDTPETVHPTEPLECYGLAASSFTTRALEGEQVRLEFDVERTDRYGRMLSYLFDEGSLFNERLVAEGYAQVSTYPPNVKYAARLLAAQRRARETNRGLWARCSGEAGGDGRHVGGGGGSRGRCDLNYKGACIPPYPPDKDCSDISVTGFRSVGGDPHSFDGDSDGIACET